MAKNVKVGPEMLGLNVVRVDAEGEPEPDQDEYTEPVQEPGLPEEPAPAPTPVKERPLGTVPKRGPHGQYLPSRYEQVSVTPEGKTIRLIVEDN